MPGKAPCWASSGRESTKGNAVLVPRLPGRRPDPCHRCDVVIATRNRPDAIKRCLRGLARQTVDDFGVIVVVDDDVVPNETFLAAHLANMNDPDDPGVPIVSCGPFVQPPDWEPTPW